MSILIFWLWSLSSSEFQLIHLSIQTIVIFIFSIDCLIELKFCEVSRNSFSNRFCKFQLSILKNKKNLFLKKFFFKPLSISKQKSFVYCLNFPEGFGVSKLINCRLRLSWAELTYSVSNSKNAQRNRTHCVRLNDCSVARSSCFHFEKNSWNSWNLQDLLKINPREKYFKE